MSEYTVRVTAIEKSSGETRNIIECKYASDTPFVAASDDLMSIIQNNVFNDPRKDYIDTATATFPPSLYRFTIELTEGHCDDHISDSELETLSNL